jgi:hypothetical protein
MECSPTAGRTPRYAGRVPTPAIGSTLPNVSSYGSLRVRGREADVERKRRALDVDTAPTSRPRALLVAGLRRRRLAMELTRFRGHHIPLEGRGVHDAQITKGVRESSRISRQQGAINETLASSQLPLPPLDSQKTWSPRIFKWPI